MKERSDASRPRCLHLCARCGSDFVVPAAWAPYGDDQFWIRLRCGECERTREVVIADAVAQRYDVDLARGMGEIALGLRSLQRELMAEEADVLATALRLDLVDPSDFAR